ncbi:MAG: SDR family oxidoreductase [Candidatus Dormibacteraeota bacterium]|nr:SDR family oxidoreductase [Candidatus Dormibacteraeota bacterium]MBO0706291.1 SDR family oxidoreductase [Candidatus Dormibacteraeota bacterium]MBO0760019.1 SDR family oxidoreductase [Candidatus Dormibacteraeota bacterium]
MARTALVTGCGKRDGMGRAIARTLAGSGVGVVVADRVPTGVPNRHQEGRAAGGSDSWRGLESLVEEIRSEGGTASFVTGDIGSEDDAGRMVAEAAAGGGLDILVNNAAAPQGLDRQDIEEVPVEEWDDVLRINLRGTYLMSRFAVPLMRARRWGRIVNIASMAGIDKLPRSAAYSASKAGIIGFTRALAMDVAPWGVTVNAVCPGMVWTSRSSLSHDPDVDVDTERARRIGQIPAGRPGLPDDVAAAVAYLASEGASYVTGVALPLDGGGMPPFPLVRPAEEGQSSS